MPEEGVLITWMHAAGVTWAACPGASRIGLESLRTAVTAPAQHFVRRSYDERMRSVQQTMVPAGDPLVHLQTLPDGAYTIVMRAGEEIHTSRVIKVSRTR